MEHVSINLREIPGITLAFWGDAVWELFVREHFIAHKLNIHNLNKETKKLVNAKRQSKLYKLILDTLPHEYQDIAKRARNANIHTFPKSCTMQEYREATAFEAIIALLHINKEDDKILEILDIAIQSLENEMA